jgi:hypothetical protein
MTDEELIGYLFDLLDPEERAAVGAFVEAHPEAAARLDHLRHSLVPLEADREPDAVPRGLAVRTVARLAEHLVAHGTPIPSPAPPISDILKILAAQDRPVANDPVVPEPSRNGTHHVDAFSTLKKAPPEQPEARAMGGRFRADLIVAAGIGLIAVGLVLSGVGRLRHHNNVMACQNNLRTLHNGLAGYADNHDGRFPQVGVDPYPTAGTFVRALADAGQYPVDFTPLCPAATAADRGGGQLVKYTYTLGHEAPGGGVVGLWRSGDPTEQNDLLPIVADCPAAGMGPGNGPLCPHRAVNVLYVGGNVRTTTIPTVGPNGDNIYHNWRGQVGAGRDRTDVVLGRAADRP